jgi:hypothetical protein
LDGVSSQGERRDQLGQTTREKHFHFATSEPGGPFGCGNFATLPELSPAFGFLPFETPRWLDLSVVRRRPGWLLETFNPQLRLVDSSLIPQHNPTRAYPRPLLSAVKVKKRADRVSSLLLLERSQSSLLNNSTNLLTHPPTLQTRLHPAYCPSSRWIGAGDGGAICSVLLLDLARWRE